MDKKVFHLVCAIRVWIFKFNSSEIIRRCSVYSFTNNSAHVLFINIHISLLLSSFTFYFILPQVDLVKMLLRHWFGYICIVPAGRSVC